MSEEKTPEQVAKEAQDSLNKIISTEAQKLAQQTVTLIQLRIQSVQMAIAYLNEHPDDDGAVFSMAQKIFDFLINGNQEGKK
jgi:hypothetical protein